MDNVEVRFLPEESSRVIALRSGEVDVIDSITPDSREQLAGLPGVELETQSGLRLNQLFYNFRKPAGHPLADVRVREALSYAIDGEALVKDVLVGLRQPGRGRGAVQPHRLRQDRRLHLRPGEGQGRRSPTLGVTDLNLKIIWETGEFAVRHLRDGGPGGDVRRHRRQDRAPAVRARRRHPRPGARARQATGTCWATASAAPPAWPSPCMQGMYAGTAEKEKTRDTYQGYVVPGGRRPRSRRPPPRWTRPAGSELLATAQQAIWDTWPCAWAFVPKSVLAHRDRVGGLSLAPTNSYPLSTSGWRPEP